MQPYRITPAQATLIFAGATLYFIALLFLFLPALKLILVVHASLHWFITGFALFIPLFVLALRKARAESGKGIEQVLLALDVKSLSSRDWLHTAAGLVLVFAATGAILAASELLNKYGGIRSLSTTPWFMELQVYQGKERWLLVVWLAMFFFNIAGEELLWRGYIQKRMTGNHSWVLCSFLWMMFHLPFGIDLMIILLPVITIIPWFYHRTRNTLVGILIHALFNGPVFVALTLGWIP